MIKKLIEKNSFVLKNYKKILHQYRTLTLPQKAINIFGHEMFLQKNGFVSIGLAKNGIHEKTITEYAKNTIKKNDWVIDIGANIGYYAIIFADWVGTQGKVFAFEPEPSNFKILKKNIHHNNFENIFAENLAVAEKEKKTKLYLSKKASGQHKIYYTPALSKKFISIDCCSLDEYFTKNKYDIDKISFVKIDVEGSEFGVLKGMKSILENKNLEIVFEFDPNQIRDYGINPSEILKFLSDYNFHFSIINNRENTIKPITDTKKIPGCYILAKKNN